MGDPERKEGQALFFSLRPDDLLLWVLLGVIAGALASLVVPGRTLAGILAALALGIVGGALGGGLAWLWLDSRLASLFGALLVAGLSASLALALIRPPEQKQTV